MIGFNNKISPEDLRLWRKELQLTQSDAARYFAVSRATYLGWESGAVALPHNAARITEMVRDQMKRRDLHGPVTLVFTDGPMTKSPYGTSAPSMMQQELYATTFEAIARARALDESGQANGLLIMSEDGHVTWNIAQLRREFDLRSKRQPRIPVIVASEAKHLGRTHNILTATVTPDDAGYSNIDIHVDEAAGEEGDNLDVAYLSSLARVKNRNVDDVLQEAAAKRGASYIQIA